MKSISREEILKLKEEPVFQLLQRAFERDEAEALLELQTACAVSSDPKVAEAHGRWRHLYNCTRRMRDPK